MDTTTYKTVNDAQKKQTKQTTSMFVNSKLNDLFQNNKEFRQAVREVIDTFNLPEKEVNGLTLTAGYKGNNKITSGAYSAKFVDLDQNGSDYVLMFNFNDNKYLYYRIPRSEVRVKQLEKLLAQKNEPFTVEVDYDILPNGLEHSVVRKVSGLNY